MPGGILTGVPLNPGEYGKIVTNVNTVQAEREGLGDVATRWPDIRVVGTPQMRLEPDNSRVVVTFKVPWHKHRNFLAELLGWPYFDATGFKRHLPERYRNWEWAFVENESMEGTPQPVMYCVATTIKGMGLDKSWETQNPSKKGVKYYPDPIFEFAYVDAEFTTLTFDVKKKSTGSPPLGIAPEMTRYVYKHEQAGGKFLSFTGGEWLLKNGGVVKPAGTATRNFWEPFITVFYEWYDVLDGACNHKKNQLRCGKTNATEFDGYAAETLLLQKADRKPKLTQLGQRVYHHIFEFWHIPSGVNKALPPGKQTLDGEGNPIYWDIIRASTQNDPTPQKPYNGIDMTALFKP